MKPSVLFIITSDPRVSHRPAEAIRIAAGVGAWQRVQVRLLFHGPAARALAEQVDELVDEESFTQYLPLLQSQSQPFYLPEETPSRDWIPDSRWKISRVSTHQAAELSAGMNWVLRF